MKSRTILYVITPDTPDAHIAHTAEAAAKAENHLVCLLLGTPPALPMSAYGIPPYGGMNIPDNWAELVKEAQNRQDTRQKAINTVLAQSDALAEVRSILCTANDVKYHVAQIARVSDEVYIADTLRDAQGVLREVASGVLFHSPIGFRMNGALSDPIKRVFVAWDSSEAAASAVHAALPYLLEAEDVQITCIDPVMTSDHDGEDPGTDVATWLSHRGCPVTVAQYPSGGREIGTCIQDRAQEYGADLVVMGAYGHTRLLQTMLGGTTRSMLEQTTLPVFFAH